jgi:hypothetical protein
MASGASSPSFLPAAPYGDGMELPGPSHRLPPPSQFKFESPSGYPSSSSIRLTSPFVACVEEIWQGTIQAGRGR